MLIREQQKQLYSRSREESERWGFLVGRSTVWINNVRPQWFYKLGLEVAGVVVADDKILPTIFGAEGTELIISVVRSEYYFWKVVHQISTKDNIGDVSAVRRTIAEIRNNNTATSLDRMAVLENRMTPQQFSQFTCYGVILWDEEAGNSGNWIPNPLWFKPDELAFKPLERAA